MIKCEKASKERADVKMQGSKEEILEKLEDVTTYLKDALGKGIEF